MASPSAHVGGGGGAGMTFLELFVLHRPFSISCLFFVSEMNKPASVDLLNTYINLPMGFTHKAPALDFPKAWNLPGRGGICVFMYLCICVFVFFVYVLYLCKTNPFQFKRNPFESSVGWGKKL